jgi:hypothetical protein
VTTGDTIGPLVETLVVTFLQRLLSLQEHRCERAQLAVCWGLGSWGWELEAGARCWGLGAEGWKLGSGAGCWELGDGIWG